MIESPSYPEVYPNDIECLWLIEAPEGERLEITFETFEVTEFIFARISQNGLAFNMTEVFPEMICSEVDDVWQYVEY